ncbi:MAG: hypothetical protein IKO06_04285 [Alphaproteobacteria bacterium]|nr:hypothetical protein [Alphaproteobacteria bacterium]
MNSIKCKKCGKLFGYSVCGTIYPGGKEKEDIDCPYCGENNGYEMTSAFVETYKLETQNKEDDSNKQNV